MNELLNETDQAGLRALLSYHVLKGFYSAENIGSMTSTPTVAGAAISFTNTNGVKVNGSGLAARNIQASNGIVHAIDEVLAPPVTED
jgi:uncharacterized surface protein with fasciclin (FAS1) repeats